MTTLSDHKTLIQFDGICILCSKTIRFILKADRRKKFLFQALQSTDENSSPETVIVTTDNISYRHFDAILKIGHELGGIFRLVELFRILPKKWRYQIYQYIARKRFKWFGKRTTCYIPTPEEKERFI